MTKPRERKLSNRQVNVLGYVCEHPGVSVREVASACGLQAETAARALTALHSRKLVGRQSSLRSLTVPLWFPEQVALYAHERAKEILP